MFIKKFKQLPTALELAAETNSLEGLTTSSPLVLLYSAPAGSALGRHLWVSTRAVAAHVPWRHDNLLRALKQFVRFAGKHENLPSAVQRSVSAPGDGVAAKRGYFLTVEKGIYHPGIIHGKHGYAVALPVWQDFIHWLLTHTVKFKDRMHRVKSLGWRDDCDNNPSALASLSGLTQHNVFGRVISDVYAPHYGTRVEWEAAVKERTFEVVENKQQLLLFEGFQSDGRVNLAELAKFTGYTSQHLRNLLEMSAPHLTKEEATHVDNCVGYKTAMYLLLKLPRATTQRMQLFNMIYDQLRPTPVLVEFGRPNYNDPQSAKAAFEALEDEWKKTSASVLTLQREKVDTDSQLRLAVAEKEGLHSEVNRLRHGLAGSAAAGNLAADAVDDHIVRNAAHLRREHHLMGKKDALQDLSRYLHDHVLSHLLLNQHDMFAMMTWWCCEKLRDADGAPVLRHNIVRLDFARRYKVYASGAGQDGNFYKHGDSAKVVWAVFFTPMGIDQFKRSFIELRDEWVKAGKPKHCLDRSTKAEVLELGV